MPWHAVAVVSNTSHHRRLFLLSSSSLCFEDMAKEIKVTIRGDFCSVIKLKVLFLSWYSHQLNVGGNICSSLFWRVRVYRLAYDDKDMILLIPKGDLQTAILALLHPLNPVQPHLTITPPLNLPFPQLPQRDQRTPQYSFILMPIPF